MKIKYGVAILDRAEGRINQSQRMPVQGVRESASFEFLSNAGEEGWELCAALPPVDGDLDVTLVFKKAVQL